MKLKEDQQSCNLISKCPGYKITQHITTHMENDNLQKQTLRLYRGWKILLTVTIKLFKLAFVNTARKMFKLKLSTKK